METAKKKLTEELEELYELYTSLYNETFDGWKFDIVNSAFEYIGMLEQKISGIKRDIETRRACSDVSGPEFLVLKSDKKRLKMLLRTMFDHRKRRLPYIVDTFHKQVVVFKDIAGENSMGIAITTPADFNRRSARQHLVDDLSEYVVLRSNRLEDLTGHELARRLEEIYPEVFLGGVPNKLVDKFSKDHAVTFVTMLRIFRKANVQLQMFSSTRVRLCTVLEEIRDDTVYNDALVEKVVELYVSDSKYILVEEGKHSTLILINSDCIIPEDLDALVALSNKLSLVGNRDQNHAAIEEFKTKFQTCSL